MKKVIFYRFFGFAIFSKRIHRYTWWWWWWWWHDDDEVAKKKGFEIIIFFPSDIIALRNIAAAVRSPFNEINRLYSKTIQATKFSRPFSSITKLENSYLVDLVLLPHQIIALPNSLYTKLVLPPNIHDYIQRYDKEDLRYYF